MIDLVASRLETDLITEFDHLIETLEPMNPAEQAAYRDYLAEQDAHADTAFGTPVEWAW